MLMQHTFTINTSQRMEMIDINSKIDEIVAKSGVKEGLCSVFVQHATAAIAVNENYDPNICLDFNDLLAKLIPQGKWRHDAVDGNADAHIKATIVGPNETIPIKNGKLLLGTWQSIMLCEFDGPRQDRKVTVTIIK